MARMARKQFDASSEHAKDMRKRGGKWLQEKRQEAGLSQRELGLRLGIDYYTFISQIEIGKGRVPPETYAAYAKALGMSEKDFVKKLLVFYDPYTYKALFGAPKKADYA